MRKTLDSYVANTPPHVVAARRLVDRTGGEPPRVIAYRITTSGPEAVELCEHEPDREHYVEKQVRPVAEPVLNALGLDFAQVIHLLGRARESLKNAGQGISRWFPG